MRLDWVTLTVFENAHDVVPLLMRELFNTHVDDPMEWSRYFSEAGHGARRFKSLCFGPAGIKLYRLPHSGTYCSVEIPGEAIEELGQDAITGYVHTLCDGHNFRATRVDIACDHAPFAPRDCYDAWKAHNVLTEVQRESFKWLESASGDTFNIGARSSPRYVRIYNRRGFTRVELELKQHWADGMLVPMAWVPYEYARDLALGHLRQFADFVDRSACPTLADAPMLPWWAAFVGQVQRATYVYKRPSPSSGLISRTRAYLERLLPTLCTLKTGLGVSLDTLCDGSEHRLKGPHLRKIAELQRALGDSEWNP